MIRLIATQSLALGLTTEVNEIFNHGNYDSTWRNVEDVHENAEDQEMRSEAPPHSQPGVGKNDR